jgi:aconitate hydratase
MQTHSDPFGALTSLETASGTVSYYQIGRLAELGHGNLERLPFSIRILLENLLRRYDGRFVTEDDVLALAAWNPTDPGDRELPFLPARVLLQDFTGIPVVADLAALRAEMKRLGGDPERVNPAVPVDLVIDHSVQVDVFGTPTAFAENVDLEYERNRERYTFLKWAQRAFNNFQVVPPGAGIVHQVNLEFLARVVQTKTEDGRQVALPDTLVGTDSHTTMINGLGCLGWGVGGIEAEAAMLNQPLPLLAPEVIGVRLTGSLRPGVTATDIVLTVTQMLRKRGVVGKFVEYCGPGLSNLALADRATIANMSPEYGATVGYFPVDAETLRFLRLTGRDAGLIDLVERYCRAQGLFREDDSPEPVFTDLLTLDLSTVESSLAGPRRPQDRVPLGEVPAAFRLAFEGQLATRPEPVEEIAATAAVADTFPASDPLPAQSASPGGIIAEEIEIGEPVPAETADISEPPVEAPIGPVQTIKIGHGSVAIAAITSCTNTSNPSVMLGAGILAKKAVERGLTVAPTVKTSLAPGSRAVIAYLERAGLLPHLEALRFNLVGFGCTTCIGNSGPLPETVASAVDSESLVVAAVLSGNRNFEGRIHPQVRASYLASPPLVVAYALAGSVNVDLTTEPLGIGTDGSPVYLHEIWPTSEEISEALAQAVTAEIFEDTYRSIFEGDERWRALPVPEGALYEWDMDSTYLRQPPFVEGLSPEPQPLSDIRGARVLAMQQPGRTLPAGARRAPARIQQLRGAARKPRGHGPGHLCECTPAQRTGAGYRGWRNPPLPIGRADVDL